MSVGGFARCVAAWTSRQGACEGDDQVSAHRRDRVWRHAVRDGLAAPRGVRFSGKPSAGKLAARPAAEGESSPARRSGRRRRRCTAWRDGGSRASLVLRNVQGRVPVSAPGSRARCASAIWPDRPVDRTGCPAGRWQASIWRVRRRPRAIRSAAIPRPRLGPPIVAMCRPHPNPGKARCQRSGGSLAPRNYLPACLGQVERERLDTDRTVLGVAAHELGATAATRPRLAAAAVPSPAATPKSAAASRRHRSAPERRSPRAPGIAAIPGVNRAQPPRRSTAGTGRRICAGAISGLVRNAQARRCRPEARSASAVHSSGRYRRQAIGRLAARSVRQAARSWPVVRLAGLAAA